MRIVEPWLLFSRFLTHELVASLSGLLVVLILITLQSSPDQDGWSNNHPLSEQRSEHVWAEAFSASNSLYSISLSEEIQKKLPSRSQKDQLALVTHQEYPLQLVLNVLHPRKGSHALDHLDEDAAHPPERQNEEPAQYLQKHLSESIKNEFGLLFTRKLAITSF